MKFTKYEAAGNTYVILHKDGASLSADRAQAFCHPAYGVGSDGVIGWTMAKNRSGCVHVDIYNPDGSVAEKSGNGLRILATFLFEQVFPDVDKIDLMTLGGRVSATRTENKGEILLEMGIVTPQSDFKGALKATNGIAGVTLTTAVGDLFGYPVSIGNPHFVIFDESLSAEKAHEVGPLVENHPAFPNRTNVQFAKVINHETIMAEIWERGAGYTPSSGSSSCAIGAVAHHLGLCASNVTINMPGGQLKLSIAADDGTSWLTGPVNKTVEGMFVY